MADQVGEEAMRCYICREGSNPIQSISHSLVAVAVAMSHSPDRLPPEIVQEGEEEEEGEEHAAVDEHLVQVLAVLDHPHDRSRETQRVAHIQQLPVRRLDERKHRGMRYRSSSITTTTKTMCAGVYLDELVLLAKRGENGGPHLVDVLCGPVGPVQRIRLLIQVVDRDRRRLAKGVCRESVRGLLHTHQRQGQRGTRTHEEEAEEEGEPVASSGLHQAVVVSVPPPVPLTAAFVVGSPTSFSCPCTLQQSAECV